MSPPVGDQSLAELLGSLTSSIPHLVRDEVELLRRQLAFALARIQAASAFLVIAVALAVAIVLLLGVAAVSALTILFVSMGLTPPVAVALASLAAAVVASIVAALLLIGARGELRRAQAAIGQSIDAVTGNATEKDN
jgi:hypothetical protein